MPNDNVRRKWRKIGSGGGTGGGGGESCCCACVCVEPNMIHPGGFETVREWQVTIKKRIPFTPTADANGEVGVEVGSWVVTWSVTSEKWTADIANSVIYQDSTGAVVNPVSKSGTLTMEWSSVASDFIVEFTFDAAGGPDAATPIPGP